MNYTLNQLQIFLKVVQTESVTKASEEMNLTQPAVSIQLKNFQEQFDIPLTEIIGRKLFVTDFGREIAISAENILNLVYAINYKTMAFKGKLTGRLRLSVVSSGKYIMPFFLTDFLQNHEGISLEIDVTNKEKVLESLTKNDIDFALVSTIPENLHVEKIELMPNKLFLVGNSSFSLPEQTLDILKNKPLIYREKGSATRSAMENFLSKKNITSLKKLELTSNEAVKQALLAGLGISIMPLIGLKNEIQLNQIQIIPIHGLPIETNWKLIWMKGKKFSPVAQAYLDYLELHKSEIVEEKFKWIENY